MFLSAGFDLSYREDTESGLYLRVQHGIDFFG